MSQMPLPLSWVPRHNATDPLKWMRDDRRDVWHGRGLKNECKRGVWKNPSCQMAKPSKHISSHEWARIQINIFILTKPVGLIYAAALPSGWSHITTLEVWMSTETIDVMVWSSSSWLGICDGLLTVVCLLFFFFLMSDSVLFHHRWITFWLSGQAAKSLFVLKTRQLVWKTWR